MPKLIITVNPYANIEKDPARSHWWIASAADGDIPMGAWNLVDASREAVAAAAADQHPTYDEVELLYPDGEFAAQ